MSTVAAPVLWTAVGVRRRRGVVGAEPPPPPLPAGLHGLPDGAREEGGLPALRAMHAALHVQQLRARLLLLAPQPRQLPRQRLAVAPQPLELLLLLPVAAACRAGLRHPGRSSSGAAAAPAADVGEEVALAGEEVGVRELPPVRAHLAESLRTHDRTADMSNAFVKSIDEPTNRIGEGDHRVRT